MPILKIPIFFSFFKFFTCQKMIGFSSGFSWSWCSCSGRNGENPFGMSLSQDIDNGSFPHPDGPMMRIKLLRSYLTYYKNIFRIISDNQEGGKNFPCQRTGKCLKNQEWSAILTRIRSLTSITESRERSESKVFAVCSLPTF